MNVSKCLFYVIKNKQKFNISLSIAMGNLVMIIIFIISLIRLLFYFSPFFSKGTKKIHFKIVKRHRFN